MPLLKFLLIKLLAVGELLLLDFLLQPLTPKIINRVVSKVAIVNNFLRIIILLTLFSFVLLNITLLRLAHVGFKEYDRIKKAIKELNFYSFFT